VGFVKQNVCFLKKYENLSQEISNNKKIKIQNVQKKQKFRKIQKKMLTSIKLYIIITLVNL